MNNLDIKLLALSQDEWVRQTEGNNVSGIIAFPGAEKTL